MTSSLIDTGRSLPQRQRGGARSAHVQRRQPDAALLVDRSSQRQSVTRKPEHLLETVGRQRLALLAVAVVFAALSLSGLLALWPAILSAALTMAALVVLSLPSSDADEPGERRFEPQHGQRDAGGLHPSPAGPLNLNGWHVLVDALPQAALVLDRETKILHFNEAANDVLPKVRHGKVLMQLSRSPDLEAAVAKCLSSGEQATVTISQRIPIERHIEVICSRLQFSGQGSSRPEVLLTFRDLTERDRLMQMRADFIANASHELRTPLASLRGMIETLEGPARKDLAAREKFLRLMAVQAARMTRLIDDLLSLSRVEMRAHLPPRGIVDLNDVAGFVVQALDPVAESAGVTLSLSKLAGGPAEIRGERDEIVQVLQNLVHNAIKYGSDGGRVDVSVSRPAPGEMGRGEHLVFEVRDFGAGIAREDLPRLTERFYRTSTAIRKEQSGTGLGLAIVKHILARHKAELDIQSDIGKGSAFRVIFNASN